MPKIFIAPANLACDQADLEHSIGNPVERQRIIDNFSDATYPELIDIERRGRGFHAWGIKLSPDHMEHWIQMGIGDFVLISYKGAYRHYGKVLGRYENEAAAQAVWNQPDDPKDLRELMFFVTEPVSLSVTLNDVAEYLPEHCTEFQAIPEEAIDRITADFESVERFFRHRFLNTAVGGPILDMSGIIRVTEREQANLKAFDPESSKDGREKTVEMIIRRRGQPGFREALLDAYEHQCAITHCNAADALEAAYIIPYRGNYTHDASNGILLRADLHTLFDLGKIAVDTRTMTLVLADELLNTSYRILVNRPLHYPRDETCRPSTEGLDLHRRLAGL